MFLIYSNEKEIVEQQQLVYKLYGKRQFLQSKRIKEIESGGCKKISETNSRTSWNSKPFFKTIRITEKDILLLLATVNTFQRIDKLGIIPLLIKAAKLNVNIRILTDIDSSIKQILEKYGNDFDHN